MTNIAFIGLGNMGGPMARNLLKAQHGVCAFDLSAAALKTATDAGATAAKTANEAIAGADVIVNYVANPADAEDVAHQIEDLGRRAVAIKADVSKEDEVIAMFARSIEHFGTLHVLVSNAGLQRDSAFVEMTLDQWNTVIGVNLTGQFLCTREAARGYRRSHESMQAESL